MGPRQRRRQLQPVAYRQLLFAEGRRQPSAKFLPSAREMALGKDPFADGKFPEGSLPRAALGKDLVCSSVGKSLATYDYL